jgi:hypothetical protein
MGRVVPITTSLCRHCGFAPDTWGQVRCAAEWTGVLDILGQVQPLPDIGEPRRSRFHDAARLWAEASIR